MNCGHLFNGIGGFALSAHWMGWNNVMHCEIDHFCNRVMNYHFPKSKQHEDIRTTDFSIYRGKLDILTGGFPCQPYSTAGKRKGKEDERHLWPEMLRAIREISPRWVVGENVRGLISWNGGLVFDEVQADLEAAGYEVLPFLLPAAGLNAPHRRDRIFFVAHAKGERDHGEQGNFCEENERQGAQLLPQLNESDFGHGGSTTDTQRNGYDGNNSASQGQQFDGGRQARCQSSSFSESWTTSDSKSFSERERANEADAITEEGGAWYQPGSIDCGRIITDASSCRVGQDNGIGESKLFDKTFPKSDWSDFPTQSPLCSRNDGVPAGLVPVSVPGRRGRRALTEKQAMGRIRNESIKAAGNAIVPHPAYQIFKAIEQYENLSA